MVPENTIMYYLKPIRPIICSRNVPLEQCYTLLTRRKTNNIFILDLSLEDGQTVTLFKSFARLERIDCYDDRGELLSPCHVESAKFFKCYCSVDETRFLVFSLASVFMFNCTSINKLMHMINGNIYLIFIGVIVLLLVHLFMYFKTFATLSDLWVLSVLPVIHFYDLYHSSLSAVLSFGRLLNSSPRLCYGIYVCQLLALIPYWVVHNMVQEMTVHEREELMREARDNNREMHALNGNICVFVYYNNRRTYIVLHVEWVLMFHSLMKNNKWVSFFVDKVSNSCIPSSQIKSQSIPDLCWVIDPFFIPFLVDMGRTPMHTVVFYSLEVVVHMDHYKFSQIMNNNPQPLPDYCIDNILDSCKMVAFIKHFKSWVNPMLTNRMMHSVNGNIKEYTKFTLEELEKALPIPEFDSFNYRHGECQMSLSKFESLRKTYNFIYVHKSRLGDYALNDYRFIIIKKNSSVKILFTEMSREEYYDWVVKGEKPTPVAPLGKETKIESEQVQHTDSEVEEHTDSEMEEKRSVPRKEPTAPLPKVVNPPVVVEKPLVVESGYDVDGLELPLLADLRDGEKPSLILNVNVRNLFMPFLKMKSTSTGYFYDRFRITLGLSLILISLTMRSFSFASYQVHLWIRLFSLSVGLVCLYFGRMAAVSGDVSWFELHKQELLDSKEGFSKDDNAKLCHIHKYKIISHLRTDNDNYKVTESYWAVSHDLISEIMAQATVLTNLDSIVAFVDTRIASLSSRLKNLNLDIKNVNCGVIQSTKLICTALLSKTMMEAKGQGFI